MDLDGVLHIAALLLYWRVVLCVGISSLAAFLLAQHLPGFTGFQGIALAVLGLLPGVMWHETTHLSLSAPTARPTTSNTVAILAALLFGAAWGAVSSDSMQSALAGMVVLVGAAWGWYRYAVVSYGRLPRELGLLCTVVAAFAYLGAAAIAHGVFLFL